MTRQIIIKIIIIYTVLSVILFSSCENTDDKITDEKGRELIVLACNQENHISGDLIDKLVSNYNSSSEKFYIEEKKYLSVDNLLIDVIGGQRIDVLFASDWIDVSPLYAKGALCDLYEFIDNDSDISRDTYVSSVIKSMEVNGKLYEIPYDFYVESAIVKEKLWGDDYDTSFEHIIEKSKSLGCIIPYDLSADSYAFISYIISEYVDLSDSSCSFDDGNFEEYIKFMKQYYIEIQNSSNDELYDKLKNDELLVMSNGFSGFNQIEYLESKISDKVKFIGFPSEIENYHIAIPRTSFSILTNSQNAEGAFDFIKCSTSYRAYIDKVGSVETVTHNQALPINQSALNFRYNKSIEDNFYGIDEKAKRIYCDEIMKQINSINGSGNMTCKPIANILSEEITSYFNGDKDPTEVCRIIQNRVSIYLNEQK